MTTKGQVTNKMKEIIEKIVRQEIKEILLENKVSIKEMVRTSLLPELKATVREEIINTLDELLPQNSEALKRPVPIKEALHFSPTSSEIPESATGPASNNSETHNTAGGQVLSPRQPPLSEAQVLDDGQVQSTTLQADKSKIGLYLYCIADGSREISLGNMGIEGHEVYTIPFGNLSAFVHDCTAEPYHSDDHDKVKAWVLTHQKVVDVAWEKFETIIPIGFDTIIQGKEDGDPKKNMKKWIEADYDNLTSKLAKIKGKAEYGVQILWETKMMAYKLSDESVEIKQLQEEIKTKPKGIAYMYRQKLEELLKRALANKADQYFQEFYEEIKTYADDLRVEKTKKTDNEEQQMLLNLSCLLPKDRNEKLGEALEKIDGREGFSVRYTGPWPPYSFV